MTKAPDRILVVDVESTCWQGPPPPGEQSEIIEIGLCTLDPATGERLERESILVKPQRSKVSAFCTELTTLTPDDLREGVPFDEACERLRDQYRSREQVWASYGAYDRKMFTAQCASLGVEYPFGDRHVNVKAGFARLRRLDRQVGMARALKLMGRPLEGTHHRGGDDAWNIAGILAALLEAAPLADWIETSH